MPVKFQSNTIIITPNRDFARFDNKTSYGLILNRGPLVYNYLVVDWWLTWILTMSSPDNSVVIMAALGQLGMLILWQGFKATSKKSLVIGKLVIKHSCCLYMDGWFSLWDPRHQFMNVLLDWDRDKMADILQMNYDVFKFPRILLPSVHLSARHAFEVSMHLQINRWSHWAQI